MWALGLQACGIALLRPPPPSPPPPLPPPWHPEAAQAHPVEAVRLLATVLGAAAIALAFAGIVCCHRGRRAGHQER